MMFQVFKPAAPTKQPSCGSTRRNPRWILNVTDTNGLVLDLVMEAGECGVIGHVQQNDGCSTATVQELNINNETAE